MKAIRRQKTSLGENPQTANPSSDSSEAIAYVLDFFLLFSALIMRQKEKKTDVEIRRICCLI